MSGGFVSLVGAGPGDPGLLSGMAFSALCVADVVVYDRLVNQHILRAAPESAERIDVGKTPGKHGISQEEISRILIEKARAGKRVVRLKGGDPFVFGRGGEEALALLEAGVSFEVIPGVTAGVAAAAYAGIPLTHRESASCVTFVTGHEDPAKPESALNYEALAATGGTLVFYMGVKHLPQIAKNLAAAGLAEDTPAACIERGTTPLQRSVRATLADIADKVRQAGIRPPAITVVGKVAGLPEELNWFERRPLFSRRIVNTRPVGQALHLTSSLEELGAQVLSLPAIEIADPPSWDRVDAAIDRLDGFDWVVFTSAHAALKFLQRLRWLGKDARALGQAKIACVGTATRAELSRFCLDADLEPDEFTTAALLQSFRECEDVRGRRILLPRSSIARKELVEGFRELGAETTEVTTYLTRTNTSPETETVEAVRRGECDIVTFTSSSTVRGFVEIIGAHVVRKLTDSVRFASIGPVTTATARELGIPVAVEAAPHTADGLVKAILDMARTD